MKVYVSTIEYKNEKVEVFNSRIEHVMAMLVQLNNVAENFKVTIVTTEMTEDEFNQKIAANITASLMKIAEAIAAELAKAQEKSNNQYKDILNYMNKARQN